MACAVGGLVVAVPPAGRSASGPGTRVETNGDGPSGRDDGVPGTDLPAPEAAPAPTAAPTTADVGALPQTDERPTATSPREVEGARALWDAVVADDPDVALGFFFPRSAYRQVKDIGDPDGDYDRRLIANFRTDVHDLHAQLGPNAATAAFEGLHVPDEQAQWIQPGVEYNKGSYWRVLGATLQYRVDGVEHTLPVASLISWRGEWYVVHLGPIR